MIRLIEGKTGDTLIEEVLIRSTFPGRLRGFSFYKIPKKKTAMLFLNTRKIHTFGMFFSLDLFYFDASFRCLEDRRGVRPNSIPCSPKGTRHILEVPHGILSSITLVSQGGRMSLNFRVGT